MPNIFTTLNAGICQGSIYSFNGEDLVNAGQYFDTLTGLSGCDSIIILNLTVSNMLSSSFDASICQGDYYTFNNQIVNIGGAYTDTLISAGGCDSLVTLNLLVNPVTSYSFNQSICQGGSYLFHGQNISAAGVYIDTLTGTSGCDSVVRLNLAVMSLPIQPTITAIGGTAFCQGDSVILQSSNQIDHLLWSTAAITRSITVTTSGIYNVQASNQCGDTLSDNISVTVWGLPQQPVIVQNGDTLISSIAATSYQWYLNSQPIAGAINREHITQQAGPYYVEITDTNGCINNSDIFNAVFTSLSAASNLEFRYSIFPNPNRGVFSLQMFSETTLPVEIDCFDIIGHRVYSKEFIMNKGTLSIEMDFTNLGGAVYFFQIGLPGKVLFDKVTIVK